MFQLFLFCWLVNVITNQAGAQRGPNSRGRLHGGARFFLGGMPSGAIGAAGLGTKGWVIRGGWAAGTLKPKRTFTVGLGKVAPVALGGLPEVF